VAAAVNFEETLRYFRGGRVRDSGAAGSCDWRASAEGEPIADGAVAGVGGKPGARIFNEVMPRIARVLMEEVRVEDTATGGGE